MAIQNLNTSVVVTSRTLQSEVKPQNNPQPIAIENSQKQTLLPEQSLSDVLSPQLKSSLLESRSRILKAASSRSENATTPSLKAYDSVSEFERLQQLSSLIGIDIQV